MNKLEGEIREKILDTYGQSGEEACNVLLEHIKNDIYIPPILPDDPVIRYKDYAYGLLKRCMAAEQEIENLKQEITDCHRSYGNE